MNISIEDYNAYTKNKTHTQGGATDGASLELTHSKQAWLRAMENAQRDTWLNNPLLTRHPVEVNEKPSVNREIKSNYPAIPSHEHSTHKRKIARESAGISDANSPYFNKYDHASNHQTSQFPSDYDNNEIALNNNPMAANKAEVNIAIGPDISSTYEHKYENAGIKFAMASENKKNDGQVALEIDQSSPVFSLGINNTEISQTLNLAYTLAKQFEIRLTLDSSSMAASLNLNKNSINEIFTNLSNNAAGIHNPIIFKNSVTIPPLANRTDLSSSPESLIFSDLVNEIMPTKTIKTDRLAERQPLRIHAELHGEDVRIWLGLDTGASESDIVNIARNLFDFFNFNGVRVISLICNGQIIYMTGHQKNTDQINNASWKFSSESPTEKFDTNVENIKLTKSSEALWPSAR